MHTGSCLCGGVRFEIEGELESIQLCHCGQCRKAQGTPFASNIPVAASSFRLRSGAELLREFESSPGKKRIFCSRCGSPVFSKREQMPEVLRIRAGIIDGPLDTKPAAHFYTASKADWWEINDALPAFAEAYIPPAAKKI